MQLKTDTNKWRSWRIEFRLWRVSSFFLMYSFECKSLIFFLWWGNTNSSLTSCIHLIFFCCTILIVMPIKMSSLLVLSFRERTIEICFSYAEILILYCQFTVGFTCLFIFSIFWLFIRDNIGCIMILFDISKISSARWALS